ncbi:MAG: DNA replication/repair protein RecF [Eubacteriales bacterium]|nr:DNA replication/repair protein RecF [Eubacteriales bacterium]MDD4421494.1 DNA replication/repair protein RecF [Eubacteriales bacterium]HBR32293.1 DNA replication/repair protein RecF [Clostridiales bacterium]
MKITSLNVNNFKNSEKERIEFKDGINIIFGDNAAGKTNLLEAIFLFAAGKSFRGSKDKNFVRFGQDYAFTEIVFENKSGNCKLGIKLFKNAKKQIFREGVQISKLSEYLGLFRAVIFTPDHLNLVKGSPEFRRRFIDLAICQSFPRYVATASEYNRILAQKNALLKNRIDSEDLLEVYNERLSFLAAHITSNRLKFLKQLQPEAKAFQHDMTNGAEELSLDYISQAGEGFESTDDIKNRYLDIYKSKKEQEKYKGVTLFGPHKDDFTIFINKKNARLFASQGQQRSAVLSLKLAEGELSNKLTGEYPVFLLDDILSELDSKRKKYILDTTYGKQVIITGCDKEFFSGLESRNKIYVENGRACFYT